MTGWFSRKTAAFLMVAIFGFSNFGFAMPSGWSVHEGEATFEIDSDGVLNIAASDKAIIEFQTFSIGEDESVRFLQDSSQNSVLARVTGGLESLIYGDLFATGNLILVNTSGIHVFDTASIQAQSFLASTLDIENAMYREGEYVFEQVGDIAGFINNEGHITVQPGGFAALLAGGISNSGEIIADKGEILIASGEKMTLTFGNTGINLIVDESIQNRVNEAPLFNNTGLVQSNDGRINVSASLLNQTLDTLINNEGVMEATNAVVKDGVITFTSNGEILNSGTIRAEQFSETGYTFRTTGVMAGGLNGGIALYDNLDGAANISGSIGSNQMDTGDLNVSGDITLTASVVFTADSDQNGVGAFNWTNPNASIDLNDFSLTIKASEDSTLRAFTDSSGSGSLSLDRSEGSSTPTFTSQDNLAIGSAGTLSLANGVTLDLNDNNLSIEQFSMVNGAAFYAGSGSISHDTITMGGGTYDGESSTITITNLNVSNGTFTSTSGILSVGDLITWSGGTFNHNNGTLKYTDAASAGNFNSTADLTFYDVEFNTPGEVVNFQNGGDMIILNDFVLTEGDWNGGTIEARGDVSLIGNGSESDGSLLFAGANTQSFSITSGDSFNKMVNVNKSGGSIQLQNAFTLNSGSDFTIQEGTFDSNGNNFIVTGGAFVVEDGGVFRLKGSETAPSTGDISLQLGSTVYYDGENGSFTEKAYDYSGSTVVFGGSNAVYTLGNPGISASNMSITSSNTLDVGTSDIAVDTDFSNEGTLRLNATDNPTYSMTNDTDSGTVEFYDMAEGDHNPTAYASEFYNFKLSSGNFSVAANNFTVNNNFELAGGSFRAPSNPGTYKMFVTGDFIHSGGTFDHNSGNVTLNGTDQTISGDTTFNELEIRETINDSTDRTITFEAGSTQTITGLLLLDGLDSDDRINLVSSNPGTQWNLNVTGGNTIDYIEVTDSNASSGNVITHSDSLNGGNNVNWSFGYTWSGGASTDWGTAANWDLGNVPGVTDEVIIADVANDPILDANRTIGYLTINSGAVLDLENFDFTVTNTLINNGTIRLQGGNTITIGTMDTDSGTIIYDGSGSYAELAFGDAYFNLEFDNNAGGDWTLDAGLDVNGDLTITNGSLIDDGNTVNIAGDFSNADSFVSTGTVTFDGGVTQTLNSGGSAADNDFTNITISGNSTLQLMTNALVANGSVSIDSGSILDLNGQNFSMSDTLSNSGTLLLEGGETVSIGTMDLDSGLVKYDGLGSYAGLAAGDNYFDLEFDNTGTWTLDANLDVNGDLTFTSGTFDDNGNTIYLSGDWTNAGSYVGSGTLVLDGATTQNVNSGGVSNNDDFLNLTVTNSTDAQLSANNILINGNLTIGSGSTFNSKTLDMTVDTLVNNGQLTLTGNETISITNMDTDSGLVQYIGSGMYIGLSGGYEYYNLEFETGGGSWQLNDDLDINGYISIQAGTLTDMGFDINLAGNWINAASYEGTGTVTFDGSASQTITTGGSDDDQDFQNLTISNSSANVEVITNSIQVGGTLTINNGAVFDANAQDTEIGTLSNTGTLLLNGSEILTITNMDTDSGLVKYDGVGGYIGLTGGDSYYDLEFAGNNFTLNSALDVNGDLSISSGTLIDGAQQINVAGDFSNSSAFTSTGTFILDGVNQSVSGSSAFNNLTVQDSTDDSTDHTVTFEAGQTQAVSGVLTFAGNDSDDRVKLLSSASGTQWLLNSSGTLNVDFVNVQDSDASAGNLISTTNSVDSGNNLNWSGFPSTVVDPGSPAPSCESTNTCGNELIDDSAQDEDVYTEEEYSDYDESEADQSAVEDTETDEWGSLQDTGVEKIIDPEISSENRQRSSFIQTEMFIDPCAGVSDKANCTEESGTHGRGSVYVREGVVDVNNLLIYPGESIVTDFNDGKSHIIPRAVYVATSEGIVVIRAKQSQTIRTFHTGSAPEAIGVTPDGERVIYTVDGKLARINSKSLRPQSIVNVNGDGFSAITISSDGKTAYLANQREDKIQSVNLETGTLGPSFLTGSGPVSVVVSEHSGKIYSANSIDGTVTVIDQDYTKNYKVGVSPYDIVEVDQRLYVSDASTGQIHVLTADSGQVETSVNLGVSIRDLQYDPNTRRLYAADYAAGTVYQLDIDTLNVQNKYEGFQRPASILITPESDQMFVSDVKSGEMAAYDLKTQAQIQLIKTGMLPGKMTLVSPAKERGV